MKILISIILSLQIAYSHDWLHPAPKTVPETVRYLLRDMPSVDIEDCALEFILDTYDSPDYQLEVKYDLPKVELEKGYTLKYENIQRIKFFSDLAESCNATLLIGDGFIKFVRKTEE